MQKIGNILKNKLKLEKSNTGETIMRFDFDVDESVTEAGDPYFDDGEMIRCKLTIVPCKVNIYQSSEKEDGWEWRMTPNDTRCPPEFALTRAGKKKLKWPLSDRSTHYIMAAACKGKKLTPGEIEGSGAFGNLLETLVERYYDVRATHSDCGRYTNIAWPPTIIACPDQKPELRKGETGFEDDTIPEKAPGTPVGDIDDDSCPF